MNFDEAIETATKLHAGQFRDGENPLPYITHPIEVLLNLRYIGQVSDEEMLCAALMHDTVEAGTTSSDQLAAKFGSQVGALVNELTRREPTSDEIEGLSKGQIWQLRAEMLIDEIGKMSPDAQVIKLADRLANLKEAFRTKKGAKLDRYLWQTKKILETIPRKRNKFLWDAIQWLAESR